MDRLPLLVLLLMIDTILLPLSWIVPLVKMNSWLSFDFLKIPFLLQIVYKMCKLIVQKGHEH